MQQQTPTQATNTTQHALFTLWGHACSRCICSRAIALLQAIAHQQPGALDRHRLRHAQRPAHLDNAPQLEACASKQPLVLLPRALAPVRLHHQRSQRCALLHICIYCRQTHVPCHALKDTQNQSSRPHAEQMTKQLLFAAAAAEGCCCIRDVLLHPGNGGPRTITERSAPTLARPSGSLNSSSVNVNCAHQRPASVCAS